MERETKKKPVPEGEPKTCPECQGRGWVDNCCITPDHAHKCMYCDGKGFDALENVCYACHGTGLIEVRKVDKNPCPLCSGAGVYPVPASMQMSDFAYRPGPDFK
jgi:DnaJ-class molecular chaperone